MATQTAAATPPLTVVPDASIYKEIENAIDAPGILAAAIEEYKKQRTDARAELVNAIGADLATAPVNVDTAIEKVRTWKAKDKALAEKIEATEELLTIIEAEFEALKTTQPVALRNVLQAKINQLEVEIASENDKEKFLREQIKLLKSRLREIDSSITTEEH